ncbi:hypothetical protein HDK90DRAFT_356453 [Phyllosticta capitalensis]|uniref:Secreted protein n=1 Tax=Phyllosticta capitalensis TaxID=121624 RepID=A0ABR1YH81_9PEZI
MRSFLLLHSLQGLLHPLCQRWSALRIMYSTGSMAPRADTQITLKSFSGLQMGGCRDHAGQAGVAFAISLRTRPFRDPFWPPHLFFFTQREAVAVAVVDMVHAAQVRLMRHACWLFEVEKRTCRCRAARIAAVGLLHCRLLNMQILDQIHSEM